MHKYMQKTQSSNTDECIWFMLTHVYSTRMTITLKSRAEGGGWMKRMTN